MRCFGMRRIRRGVGERLLRGSIIGASGQGGVRIVEQRDRTGALKSVRFFDPLGNPIRLNKAIMSTMPSTRREVAARVREINSVQRGAKAAGKTLIALKALTPQVRGLVEYFSKLERVSSIKDGHTLALGPSGKKAAMAFNPITDAVLRFPELQSLANFYEFDVPRTIEEAIIHRRRIPQKIVVKATADYVDYRHGDSIARLILTPKGLQETAREKKELCIKALDKLEGRLAKEQKESSTAEKLSQSHADERKFLLGITPKKNKAGSEKMTPNQVGETYEHYAKKRNVKVERGKELARARARVKELETKKALLSRATNATKHFEGLYSRLQSAKTFEEATRIVTTSPERQEELTGVISRAVKGDREATELVNLLRIELVIPENMQEHRGIVDDARRRGLDVNVDTAIFERNGNKYLYPVRFRGLAKVAEARIKLLAKLRTRLETILSQ